MRKIIHVDMDCFYASVEALDDPKLKGLPVVVGGTSNRGVVCAASYEARKFGVKSAMPIAKARELCPKAVYLPVRMPRYVEVSKLIKNIFSRYTDLIQSISLDEAFLDVTMNKQKLPYASKVAKLIKRDIKSEIGITASAGVAPNKFLAKIASDYDKPDGLYVITPDKVESFARNLPIEKIWGVGRVTERKLRNWGIVKAGDILNFSDDLLVQKFGKMGKRLKELALGIDDSRVKASSNVKSIGKEMTLHENEIDINKISVMVHSLSDKVSSRLVEKGLEAKTIHIKVKYDDFTLSTRSGQLKNETSDNTEISQKALELLEKTQCGIKAIRLIGVSVSNFLDVKNNESTIFEYF